MSSPDETSEKRNNNGRRRVEKTKIEKESNHQVMFSKRRMGLFKKASELCTLTGAEAAVVVFSPSDKTYSFSHSDVDSITNRFISENPFPLPLASNHSSISESSNSELARIEAMIEIEKKRAEEIKQAMADLGVPRIEDMTYEQLQEKKRAVLNFGTVVSNYLRENAAPDVPMASSSGLGSNHSVFPFGDGTSGGSGSPSGGGGGEPERF